MNSEFVNVLSYYQIPDITSTKQKIICPFHADVNASLSIDVDNNHWFCFGCQTGGDAFKFHKQYQNQLGNNNDLKILSEYRKIQHTKNKSDKQLVKVVDEVKDKEYYKHKLLEAKDYYYGLKKVDWTLDNSETVSYMEWRGFDRNTLNYLGAKYTYQDFYQIVFHILDNGRFKGWVARTFDKKIETKRKYLYNTGFRRRYTLAGEYRSDTVMIVEGFMDKAKANQFGIKNVVAILGWKITDYQIQKLKDAGVTTIISALDNDKCGKQGTEELRKHFNNVIEFPYPQNVKDMGDMTKLQFKRAKKYIKSQLLEIRR